MEQEAWKVGETYYLAIQTCDSGYDYTLYDANYREIDGGQIDNPEMTMDEIKNEENKSIIDKIENKILFL